MDTKHFQNEAAQKGLELALSKGYVLRSFQDSDYQYLPKIDFMFQDCPLCSGVVDVGEFQKIVAPSWKEILEDGLSVGLFDGNEIVAVSLSNDICTQYQYEQPDTIREYLQEIDKPFKTSKQFKRGETLYCFLLGVTRGYRGNGYSHVVLAESARIAKSKGYKELYLQATNPLTFKVVQKLFPDSKATAEHDCQTFTNRNGEQPYSYKSVISRGVWANIQS